MSGKRKVSVGVVDIALIITVVALSTAVHPNSRSKFHDGDCFLYKLKGKVFKIVYKDFDTTVAEGYKDHKRHYFDTDLLEDEAHLYLKISCPVSSPLRDLDISDDGSLVVVSDFEHAVFGINTNGRQIWTNEVMCRGGTGRLSRLSPDRILMAIDVKITCMFESCRHSLYIGEEYET